MRANGLVCCIGPDSLAYTRTEANAHLIAAAPELLSACQKARAAMSALVMSIVVGEPLGPVEQRVNEAQDAMIAAIAKAEGR